MQQRSLSQRDVDKLEKQGVGHFASQPFPVCIFNFAVCDLLVHILKGKF